MSKIETLLVERNRIDAKIQTLQTSERAIALAKIAELVNNFEKRKKDAITHFLNQAYRILCFFKEATAIDSFVTSIWVQEQKSYAKRKLCIKGSDIHSLKICHEKEQKWYYDGVEGSPKNDLEEQVINEAALAELLTTVEMLKKCTCTNMGEAWVTAHKNSIDCCTVIIEI